MSNFEKKFGKYAVSNLSLKLVILYVIGYVLYFVKPDIFSLLVLDVTALMNGQIWRLFSWLLVPPESGSNFLFVAIMLYFYYSIGTSLERVWGDYKYNVYIFLGIILTILSAFFWVGYLRLSGCTGLELATLSKYGIDAGFLVMSMITGNSAERFVIAAALLNVVLLFMRSRSWMSYSPGQVRRRQKFRRSVEEGKRSSRSAATIHKCAICGRTEKDGDNLEFRYCSKCEGGLEYCQDHLFSHVHVKKGETPHMMKMDRQ